MKYLLIVFTLFMTQNIEAQDWANLERFAEANATLLKAPKDDHRVVFMGNSITEGWLGEGLDYFDNSAYINRGISGQTTPQMLVRFRPDVIALEPAAVVILAGINDIAGNTGPSTLEMITDNIFSMAELAEANGIKVVLSSVLPANDFPWMPNMEPADKVIELNRRLKAYAQEKGFVYLDYFSPMVDEQKGLAAAYTYDGVHPNVAGYKIMQPLAEAAILNALSNK